MRACGLSLRQRLRRRLVSLLCSPVIDLQRFESLGENCEFGFLLRHHQVASGGFFRWAFTPLHSLIRILAADFEGVYVLDQLRPRFGAMVQDSRYDILFHSQLHSEQEPDGSRRFSSSAAEREQIYAHERAKVNYLVAKFRRRLAEERLILVLKAFAPPPAEQLRTLVTQLRPALRQRGSSLLLVTPAAADQRPGKVRVRGPHLMHAYWLVFSTMRYAVTQVVLAVLCRCGFSSFHGWLDQPRRVGQV